MKRIRADAIEKIFKELVKKMGDKMEVGKTIAVDSTLLKGYARDWKNRVCSDQDAFWGYSTTKKWVFGYKVHVICDVESELPLAFTVTPANVYDSKECFNLLNKIANEGMCFEYVVADAGYDTKDNYYFISRIFHAIPIVAMNRRNLKKKDTRDFEAYLPIKRGTELWKSIYQKRGAVERVFSRLKEELALKFVKVRGIENVRFHVALSLIAMLCIALAAHQTGNETLSKCISSFKF